MLSIMIYHASMLGMCSLIFEKKVQLPGCSMHCDLSVLNVIAQVEIILGQINWSANQSQGILL